MNDFTALLGFTALLDEELAAATALRHRIHADPRLSGEIDPDPGRGEHLGQWLITRSGLQPQRRRWIAQVDPGPAGVEPECGGHQSRPARQPRRWHGRR